jgi:hypothetical protein
MADRLGCQDQRIFVSDGSPQATAISGHPPQAGVGVRCCGRMSFMMWRAVVIGLAIVCCCLHGHNRFKELRRRGVSEFRAAVVAGSPTGFWRMSGHPALPSCWPRTRGNRPDRSSGAGRSWSSAVLTVTF